MFSSSEDGFDLPQEWTFNSRPASCETKGGESCCSKMIFSCGPASPLGLKNAERTGSLNLDGSLELTLAATEIDGTTGS